ncbi:MAG: hypothetical protein C4583_09980 [Anaerolineaceae bacterium]|nr:MAG: hypothetical protein C4583_09980 [Anaerolineaceae bacterium]
MDIDIAQLAVDTAKFLAPFLPYLLKGTKIAAKAAIEEMGEDSWEKAKEVWGKLKPKVEKNPSAKNAVEKAARKPDDQRVVGNLEVELEEVFEKNKSLARFVNDSISIGGNVTDAIIVKGNKNLVATKGGQIHQTTNIFKAKSSAKQAKAQKAYRLYLDKLRRHCNSLPLAALGGEDGDEDITLDKIYIDLDTTLSKAIKEESKKGVKAAFIVDQDQTITVMEVASQSKRLVLLGDPGAGKSSFVKYLIALQAGVLLGEVKKPLSGFDRTLIPVLVVLRDLRPKLAGLELEKLSAENQKQALANAILEKVFEDMKANKTGDAIPVIQEAFENGKVLLVLDGLDEVPQNLRACVRQAVGAALQLHKIERVIITSRSRSYVGQAVFPNFQSHTIAPFTRKKIAQFARAWYNERHQLGRITLDESKKRADDLAGTAATPEMMKMASNPMMLTSIAIIHQKDIGLPRERVRLYSLFVDVLISRWQKYKAGEGEFAPSQELAKFIKDDDRLRPTLQILAYEAHRVSRKEELANQGKSDKSKEADLSRGDALVLLEKPEYLGNIELAAEFLDYVDQRSGLLVGRGGDPEHPTSYSFPHRTIQEYLAGCYLIGRGRDRGREFYKHAAEDDFWSLAALMGAEELYYINKSARETLLDLIYYLCSESEPETEQDERALLWSGQFACLFGRETIQNDTLGNRGKAYLDRLIPRTIALLGSKFLPPRERAEAGDSLARLGDPRFDAAHWHLPKESLFGFVHIPAGDFIMGTKKKDIEGLIKKYSGQKEWYETEVEQHTVSLPDFYLARYPVTVAQFKVFVEETKYDKASESALNGAPNHPVRYVTWFDAIEYCKWLNEKLKEAASSQKGENETEKNFWQGIQDGKLIVALPSEAEWEKAARGVDAREFPWEGDFEQNNSNCNMVIGNTSAVGCFPQGQSPYHIHDLSGNVWEWTRSIYAKYPYQPEKTRETLKDEKSLRVLRGGAFYGVIWYARCASRDWDNPRNRYYGIGFRVVVGLVSYFS